MIVDGHWVTALGKPFYTVGKGPRERAEDAQVLFGAAIIAPEKDEGELEEALLSIFSTAQAATRDSHGIAVTHGHKNISETNPQVWGEVKETVLGAIRNESSPYVIFKIVGDIVWKLYEFPLLSPMEIRRRIVEAKQAA